VVLRHDGDIIAAVGVSGGSAAQDRDRARAAVASFGVV
jgi:uncharacterized protein GlcG (DUF336 family)